MSDNSSNFVRVLFPADVDGNEDERMYAVDLEDGTYLLDNSPFHAYGVSAGDRIVAQPLAGELVFSTVAGRGGHSTYRIRLPIERGHDYFMDHWSALQKLGCSFEGSGLDSRRLYAVDVPPHVDVAAVYRILESKEAEGIWEFEEAHYYDPEGQ